MARAAAHNQPIDLDPSRIVKDKTKEIMVSAKESQLLVHMPHNNPKTKTF